MTAATATPLEDALAEAVAQFPPLSEDTKDQVAHLLRAGGRG